MDRQTAAEITNPAEIPPEWGPDELRQLHDYWRERAVKAGVLENMALTAKTLGEYHEKVLAWERGGYYRLFPTDSIRMIVYEDNTGGYNAGEGDYRYREVLTVEVLLEDDWQTVVRAVFDYYNDELAGIDAKRVIWGNYMGQIPYNEADKVRRQREAAVRGRELEEAREEVMYGTEL